MVCQGVLWLYFICAFFFSSEAVAIDALSSVQRYDCLTSVDVGPNEEI